MIPAVADRGVRRAVRVVFVVSHTEWVIGAWCRYVDPSRRGTGAGKKLLAQAKVLAEETNATGEHSSNPGVQRYGTTGVICAGNEVK